MCIQRSGCNPANEPNTENGTSKSYGPKKNYKERGRTETNKWDVCLYTN